MGGAVTLFFYFLSLDPVKIRKLIKIGGDGLTTLLAQPGNR